MKEERSRTTAIDGTEEKLSKEVVNHNDGKGIGRATTTNSFSVFFSELEKSIFK